MGKQLIHLPSHRGTIRSGRVAEPGEVITCKTCIRDFLWNKEQAELLGRAAIDSAHGNPPSGYIDHRGVEDASIRHSGIMAAGAARYALRIVDYRLG